MLSDRSYRRYILKLFVTKIGLIRSRMFLDFRHPLVIVLNHLQIDRR